MSIIDTLRREARQKPVLGSLVYPSGLREALRPFFRLEPAGFLTRLHPPEIEVVPGWGHDLPTPLLPRLADGIAHNAARARQG